MLTEPLIGTTTKVNWQKINTDKLSDNERYAIQGVYDILYKGLWGYWKDLCNEALMLRVHKLRMDSDIAKFAVIESFRNYDQFAKIHANKTIVEDPLQTHKLLKHFEKQILMVPTEKEKIEIEANIK